MRHKHQDLDEVDRKILEELVKNSHRSYRQLAHDLKMSPMAVIDRIRNLEQSGHITGYGCRLDYLKLGFEFMAVVNISISGGDLLAIEGKVAKFPGVAAVWDTTGEYDAIAILMCKTRDQLSSLIKQIIRVKGVEKTNTNIVLNIVKKLTEFDGV